MRFQKRKGEYEVSIVCSDLLYLLNLELCSGVVLFLLNLKHTNSRFILMMTYDLLSGFLKEEQKNCEGYYLKIC